MPHVMIIIFGVERGLVQALKNNYRWSCKLEVSSCEGWPVVSECPSVMAGASAASRVANGDDCDYQTLEMGLDLISAFHSYTLPS